VELLAFWGLTLNATSLINASLPDCVSPNQSALKVDGLDKKALQRRPPLISFQPCQCSYFQKKKSKCLNTKQKCILPPYFLVADAWCWRTLLTYSVTLTTFPYIQSIKKGIESESISHIQNLLKLITTIIYWTKPSKITTANNQLF